MRNLGISGFIVGPDPFNPADNNHNGVWDFVELPKAVLADCDAQVKEVATVSEVEIERG